MSVNAEVSPRESYRVRRGSKITSFSSAKTEISKTFTFSTPTMFSSDKKLTKAEAFKSLLAFFICVSFGKLAFFYCYRSTDFEVHRNWLAVTRSLPLRQWYIDSTSQWTLDYPPLFAWFEYFLSFPAQLFDPEMLRVSNINYDSFNTILFQRLSVIFADFALAAGVYSLFNCLVKVASVKKAFATGLFILGDIGLLMVDHIHFQYNGFLMGFLLLSIASVFRGSLPWAALWFSILLNLKHLYLYVAPVFFVYILRWYCFPGYSFSFRAFKPLNLFLVAIPVVSVTAISFGPFLYYDQLVQVFGRLFPFKRGLCHAYWAPNFWVFYNVADKAALFVAHSGFGYNISVPVAYMTSGLVQETSHVILPNITPQITFILTALAMLPGLYMVWISKSVWHFVRSIVLCGFASFLFGWHVHEKAILIVIIPLSILAIWDDKIAGIHMVLSISGYYSLFPLFIHAGETPIKFLLLVAYVSFLVREFERLHGIRLKLSLETLYLLLFVPLTVYNGYGHYALGLEKRYPFIPLLNTSLFCAIGIFYSWLKLLKLQFEEYAGRFAKRKKQ